MGVSSDTLFFSEFGKMMKDRKYNGKNITLDKFRVQPMKGFNLGSPKGTIALVKGVTEPFFDRLNNSEVVLMPKCTLYKRKVNSDGTFRLDKNGKEVKTVVTLNRGSVAILSNMSIGLKRKIVKGGKEINHEPSEGYRYVDYIETKNGRKYIYIVPKDYVYRLNMCALVISTNSLRNYYKGAKIALKDGNYINIYVIPYKYRDYNGSRILGVKSTNNFDKEFNTLLNLWYSDGLIFDIRLTYLEESIRGIKNVGLIVLNPTNTNVYRRYNVPLSKEKENLVEDVMKG